MAENLDKIIAFVKNFKDEVILPLANDGILDAEICQQAKEIFCEQLNEQKPITLVKIEKEGEWSFLHPMAECKIKIDDFTYCSIEQYRIASAYVGMDDEFVEYVKESKTPQIAHRRGQSAEESRKEKKGDYEQVKYNDLKMAYMAMLQQHPRFLDKLKSSCDAPIQYTASNDEWLAHVPGTKSKNAIGSILMELRTSL